MNNILRTFGGILLGLCIFCGTLYLLLTTFLNTSKEKGSPTVKEYLSFSSHDPVIHRTFYNAPLLKSEIRLSRGSEIIYQQTYSSDERMFRVPMARNEKARKHAVFAGCSFTWGEGLKESETLASRFQELQKDYQAYNLGFPGGGLHTLLRYLDLFKLTESVQEEDGYFFYPFISNHLDRFFGRYNYVALNPEYAPYYEVLNGTVVYKGFVKEMASYKEYFKAQRAGLADALIRSQDPLVWAESDLKDFAVAVGELKKRYLSLYPRGHFVMIFHPVGDVLAINRVLIRYLEEQKIDYIHPHEEFSEILKEKKLTMDDMMIPHDGHPSQKANELLAQIIGKELRKDDQNLK